MKLLYLVKKITLRVAGLTQVLLQVSLDLLFDVGSLLRIHNVRIKLLTFSHILIQGLVDFYAS